MVQSLIFSFLVSVLTIPVVLYVSKRFNLYDRIDERKIHKGNISRLGGIAMFLGFVVPFWIFVYPKFEFSFNVYIYFVALVFAFGVGFIDDFVNVRARYKLLVQILVGVLVAFSGLKISDFSFFGIIQIDFGLFSNFLTVIWVVLFMNAINLLDGMDGLASGIVFIANGFVFVIAMLMGNEPVMILTLLMAGAIFGFYVFNFPPAKIFMGDGGAYFLGFMYATLPLMGLKKSAVATLFLFPIILLLLPITDIIQVVIKRMKLGYNIFIADKNHIHHRLMSLGISIKGILFLMYTYSVILGLISILILKIQPEYSLVLFVLIFIIMLLSMYMLNLAEKIIEKKERDNNIENSNKNEKNSVS